MDCPPSYDEAIRLSRSGTPTPTAPSLGNATNFPDNIGEQNDQQSGKWDEKATKIMIFRRLKMNDQFETAKSFLETDKLWNSILLELLEEEYNSFSVLDLKQYWNYLYQIYRSIVDNSSSVYDSNWVYFKSIDAVFGRQSNSLNITDPVTDLMIHNTLVNQLNVPITSQPNAFSNQIPTFDTVVTTQPTQTTVTGVPHTTITEEQDCRVACCNTCCCFREQDYYDSSYNSGCYSNNYLGNDYHYHQTYVDTSNTNHQGGCHNSNSGGECDNSGGSECHNSNSGDGCDNSGGSGCDNSGSGDYCDVSGGSDGYCDDSGGGYDDSGGGGYDDSGGGGYDDSGGGCYDD